jgi:hypothetical protein
MVNPRNRSKAIHRLLEGAASIGEGMSTIDLSFGLCPSGLRRVIRSQHEIDPFEADREAMRRDFQQVGKDLASVAIKNGSK